MRYADTEIDSTALELVENFIDSLMGQGFIPKSRREWDDLENALQCIEGETVISLADGVVKLTMTDGDEIVEITRRLKEAD